jgi:hypothetical protein
VRNLDKNVETPSSVTDRGFVALPQDGFDDTAQSADGATAPMHGNDGVFEALERFDPAAFEVALGGDDSGRQRVDVVLPGLQKGGNAKAVAGWRGQRIEAVGGGDVADVG